VAESLCTDCMGSKTTFPIHVRRQFCDLDLCRVAQVARSCRHLPRWGAPGVLYQGPAAIHVREEDMASAAAHQLRQLS